MTSRPSENVSGSEAMSEDEPNGDEPEKHSGTGPVEASQVEASSLAANSSPPALTLKTRAGIGLILLAGVFWFSLFAIPFLPLTLAQKALLGTIDFVLVQICWWVGAALAGPETVGRIIGWFRRNPAAQTDSTIGPKSP